MLSTGAFNAFLKTLEEPPAYAVFILATTEKHNEISKTSLDRGAYSICGGKFADISPFSRNIIE